MKAADSVAFEFSGRQITLRAVRAKARWTTEDRMWVVTFAEPLPENLVEETIEAVRREREQQDLGNIR